jgi:hypothetical protein
VRVKRGIKSLVGLADAPEAGVTSAKVPAAGVSLGSGNSGVAVKRAALGVAEGVELALGLLVGLEVLVGLGLAVLVAVGLAVDVSVGVALAVGEGVKLACTAGVRVGMGVRPWLKAAPGRIWVIRIARVV